MPEPAVQDQPDVARLRIGDRPAWEQIFTRCGTALYQFLWAMTGLESAAERLTTAALARAMGSAGTLPDGLAPCVWVHRIAYTIVTGARPPLGPLHLTRWRSGSQGDDPDPTAKHDHGALQSALVPAIRRLPERERCAVALHTMAHWSSDDIAVVLCRLASDVLPLLLRGRRRLRSELSPFLNHDDARESSTPAIDTSSEHDRRAT